MNEDGNLLVCLILYLELELDAENQFWNLLILFISVEYQFWIFGL